MIVLSFRFSCSPLSMMSLLTFHPPVIAHRGASADAPENTLAAIRAAREQGANWIELDVKISYDGVPLLMHDETLDRTTDGSGLIAEKNWSDMAKLDAGLSFSPVFKGEPIPHLADAVNAVLQNKMSLILEIKPCPGRAKATSMVAVIELAKIWPEGDFYPMISSFDIESLEIAAQLEPQWPRSLLLDTWAEDWRERMARTGACAISVEESLLTSERMAAFQSLALPVVAYTVNDPARAKELLAWGVAAVYADKPRAILQGL